ncbi:hypothetical protein RE433_18195 [Bacillus cereus]|nr:hypothetical protein [Bacillus cereus]WMW41012.1 hypothetical protein RE433_18195 [Bacillus cereus]
MSIFQALVVGEWLFTPSPTNNAEWSCEDYKNTTGKRIEEMLKKAKEKE